MLKPFCLTVILTFFCIMPINAQEIAVFAPPTVEYSGQRTLITPEVTIVQQVYSAPQKNRTESRLEGQYAIQIWRDDLQKIWMISPANRIATELDLASAQQTSPLEGFTDNPVILEKRTIGTEIINGVSAEKTYLRATPSGGGTADGWVWVTPENITIRMRLTVTEEDGTMQSVSYDLNDLNIAHQPATLFEIPSGYQVISMGGSGMPGLPGYMEDLAEEATDSARDEADFQIRNTVRKGVAKAIGGLFDR